ncbi:unnamed protein product [Tuber melanosporum]|jgi:hypothetical protein|uniref:(Perigord truffle) hypothetical protein n=1 Tax=Tuber melanosporum (strain Mel28) TaxID=656061 RepID=D5G436_TUBMM|nr:uncharacterized protein GSTUM_00003933001 [Tuber melanosporum]CAZ79279.1 unnamed protein product [Tuber melanosporum]
MNRYRGPFSSSAASSKATPTTRCQKCLKLGHYSYECKATISERPYTSRPSRTQQFLNPRLRQELTEAAPPSDVTVNRKKGTADEILMKNKNERDSAHSPEVRGRKRRRNSTSPSPVQSRARSISTGSSSTYSSISSGRSPTPPVYSQENSVVRHNSRRQSNSHARDDHDRSVRRKYRDSPSPRRRGRRLSPTDYPRRTRSRTPRPTYRRSITPQVYNGRKESPVKCRQVDENRPTRTSPYRERSLSPFTRRKLLTEQMQRVPG